MKSVVQCRKYGAGCKLASGSSPDYNTFTKTLYELEYSYTLSSDNLQNYKQQACGVTLYGGTK